MFCSGREARIPDGPAGINRSREPLGGMEIHPIFLDMLCCPKSGSDLQLAVDEYNEDGTVRRGALIGPNDRYPIVGSIPRFVDKEYYSASFGYEWKKWSRVQFESENTGGKMAGHTRRMFETVTGLAGDALKGKRVVEFGCGPGRFLDIVRSMGGTAVGIDLSMAVESARENFRDDADVLIVQGDVLNPPFRKGIFDAGYSIGVLHHTPDPRKGLERLCEVVKKNGLVACAVYSKGSFYDYPSVHLYRKVFNATKGVFGNRLALGYAYFSACFLYPVFGTLRKIPFLGKGIVHVLEKYLFVNLPIPDARWRVLDIFDAITPCYASTHTYPEVKEWFEKGGCRDVMQTPWGPTSLVGTKGE